jgi:hypothetical protein
MNLNEVMTNSNSFREMDYFDLFNNESAFTTLGSSQIKLDKLQDYDLSCFDENFLNEIADFESKSSPDSIETNSPPENSFNSLADSISSDQLNSISNEMFNSFSNSNTNTNLIFETNNGKVRNEIVLNFDNIIVDEALFDNNNFAMLESELSANNKDNQVSIEIKGDQTDDDTFDEDDSIDYDKLVIINLILFIVFFLNLLNDKFQ